MSDVRCPDCGNLIPAGMPDGMCPLCLLTLGVASEGGPPRDQATATASHQEQPGARIGHYRLLEPIGEGGFGTVWMAEQEEPVRRRVALKIIKLGMDTREVVARFEAERQALAMMDHPNIARVFDGGATEQGRPYFVMELVKGIRLTDYCDAHRLNTDERLRLFMEVCQAVQHAHQKGIIHRDLKPSNVLITEQDGRAVPKVIDFGIAKATEQKLTEKTLFTRFNQVIGTPAYMSPEQAGLGRLDIDTRSDVYSLGVLLYELLTGQLPFSDDELGKAGLEEVLRTIREQEPPKPSTRLGHLPPAELTTLAARRKEEPRRLRRQFSGELDWIAMKTLEKDRVRRYESASALAQDLAHYLADEPVSAAAPGIGYQLAKFARRHRLALATAAAFAVVLVAGTMISVWQAMRATQHAAAEKNQATLAGKARREAEQSFAVTRENLYAADVALAHRALAEGNLGLARRALATHRPAVNATNPLPDLRGFEWRYSWAQCQDDHIALLRGHTNAVSGLAFSTDGQTLVSGGADRTLRFWDVPSRRLLKTFSTRTNDISSVAFSFSGRRCYAVSTDGKVQVWNVQTGVVEFTYTPLVGTVALAPSLRRYATAAYEEAGARVTITAVSNGALECVLTNGQGRAGFAHDDRRVALAGPTGFAIWNLPTTQLLHQVETAVKLDALRFSRRDRWLVGWSARSRSAWLWHGTNAQPAGEFIGHTGKILDAAFSPDEKRLATAGADQSVRLWDIATRRELAYWRGHESEVRAVAFSPDGQTLASAGKDGTIRLWPMEPAAKPTEITNAFPPFVLSTDGAMFASSNHPFPQEDTPTGPWDSPFVLAEDGRWGAAAVPEGRPRTLVRDLPAMAARHRFDLRAGRPAFFEAQQTNLFFVRRHWPDGNLRLHAATPTNEPPAPSVELQDSREIHLGTVASADGRTVIAVAVTGQVLAYDAKTGVRLGTLGEIDPRRHALQLSPDGRQLAAYSTRAGATVWDVTTRAQVCRLDESDRAILGFAFSHDGRTLATAGADDEIILWHLPRGSVRARLRGHGEPVLQVAFAPDGLTLASSSADGTVKLWSVRARREVATLTRDHPLTWLAFTGDGRALVGGSARGHLKVWRAPSLREIDADTRN